MKKPKQNSNKIKKYVDSLVESNFLPPSYPISEDPNSPINQLEMGIAFTHNDLSIGRQVFSKIVLNNPPRDINHNETSYFLTFGEVKSVNSSEIDISAVAESTFGNIRVNSQFDRKATQINRSFSLVISQHRETRQFFINDLSSVISPNAIDLFNRDKDRFKQSYGDSFINSVLLGYYVNVVISFSLIENEDYEKLSSSLKANFGFLSFKGSLDASFVKTVENSMLNGTVSVSSFSRGCTAPQISKINEYVMNAIKKGNKLNVIVDNLSSILNEFKPKETVLRFYPKSLRNFFDINEPTLEINSRILKISLLLGNFLDAQTKLNDLKQVKEIFDKYANLPIKLNTNERRALIRDINKFRNYLVEIANKYFDLKKCVDKNCSDDIIINDIPESEFDDLINGNEDRNFNMKCSFKFLPYDVTKGLGYSICDYTFYNVIFRRAYIEYNKKVIMEISLGDYHIGDLKVREEQFHQAIIDYLMLLYEVYKQEYFAGVLSFIGIDLWGKLHKTDILDIDGERYSDKSVRLSYTGSNGKYPPTITRSRATNPKHSYWRTVDCTEKLKQNKMKKTK